MKKQVWFKTDLGYYATQSKLGQSRGIVGDMTSSKGRLTFYLKDFKDVALQVTTHGKLGIWFPAEVGYDSFLKRVKSLLVKADGTPAKILGVIMEPPKSDARARVEERVFVSTAEYELVLDHSKKLVNAVEGVLMEYHALRPSPKWSDKGEMVGEVLRFKEFLLQHLETGYPDTYELVLKTRAVLKNWDEYVKETGIKYEKEIDDYVSCRYKEVCKQYTDPPKGIVGFMRTDWQRRFENAILWKVTPEIFGSQAIRSLLLREDPITRVFPEKIEEEATRILAERCRIFKDLSEELNGLRLKVDMDLPLDGHCSSCPRVRIESKTKG